LRRRESHGRAGPCGLQQGTGDFYGYVFLDARSHLEQSATALEADLRNAGPA
jgi:hypothetical protein